MNRDLESVLSGLKIEKATQLNETHEKILKSGEQTFRHSNCLFAFDVSFCLCILTFLKYC